jgi:hypothetical protein
MTTKLINLAEYADDARRWSVEQMLEHALEDVRSGKRTANKAVLLWLKDNEDSYDVGFIQAGMSAAEMLALAEVAKTLFLNQMQYLVQQEDL